jgi:phosphoesterase RecJ-like protein
MNIIKANIRSRGPVINEVASKFGGGGHKYASGARLKSWTDADNLIKELDEITSTYSAK